MNKKVALILLVMMLIFTIKSEAVELENIKIEKIVESGFVSLDIFNLQDSDIQAILKGNINNKEIKYFQVEKGSKITSLQENNYIVADLLEMENSKLNHKNKFVFMIGEVLLENRSDDKINDEKVISTQLERKLIREGKLDSNYWNHVSHKKGGYIELEDTGYYLITVKDSSYKLEKSKFLVEVKEKEDHNKQPVKLVFKDVDEKDWFYEDVYSAVELGIINGREADRYEPHAQLTIAEALTLSAKIKANKEGTKFIAGGEKWYDNAVSYCIENKIISSTDFLDYDKNITREEMAYIFARTLAAEDYKIINPYISIPDLSSNKYDDYIIRLYKAGIVNGREYSHEFDPKTDINRAELAAIVNRILNNDSRKIIISKGD